MTKDEYDGWAKKEDWEVLTFCAGKETDDRTHAARHIMEMRRTTRAARAAERAAIAARWAAIAAIVSSLVAIATLFKK